MVSEIIRKGMMLFTLFFINATPYISNHNIQKIAPYIMVPGLVLYLFDQKI